jgi:pimeloyl-ACP methyl ester carboxylesterase
MARARFAQLLGVGLAVGLAVVLPGGASTRPAALAPCASIDNVLCAYVSVPLDYTHPKGRQLRLFVTARPTTGTPRGTILLLAGGPGEASTTVFDLTSDLWRSLFPGYTVAAYDNRGTGDSAPLSCPGVATARRCGAAIGPSRVFYGTRENVKDLDAVRRELGVDRIALFGLSYGTKQALAYALAYPHRVERLLLDSVVPSTAPSRSGSTRCGRSPPPCGRSATPEVARPSAAIPGLTSPGSPTCSRPALSRPGCPSIRPAGQRG